jgi:MoxR-like ATPase
MLPEYPPAGLQLPAMASWPASMHLFDELQRNALRAAEAAGRPLLVRGDPGTGKSQLAHAAAVAAGRLFLPFVVDSRTEASDLMWRYDAVARLADAHLSGVPGAGVPTGLDARHYIQPGPLWWAFNWAGALRQAASLRSAAHAPGQPQGWTADKGCVILIDEIDKAEAELPNGLLEALGNGRFAVPLADCVVERPPSQPAPLVIITTNDERELPAAFLRRCMVLTLKLPQGGELHRFLVERGELHFGLWAQQHRPVLEQAAQDLLDDREHAAQAGLYKPGMAEYLDLLRALQQVGGDAMEQLRQLSQFAYRKQPEA